MNALDIAILVPHVPALPFVIGGGCRAMIGASGKRVPNDIAATYLLYCAFAEWHFRLRRRAVLITAVCGGLLCAIALTDKRNGWLRR